MNHVFKVTTHDGKKRKFSIYYWANTDIKPKTLFVGNQTVDFYPLYARLNFEQSQNKVKVVTPNNKRGVLVTEDLKGLTQGPHLQLITEFQAILEKIVRYQVERLGKPNPMAQIGEKVLKYYNYLPEGSRTPQTHDLKVWPEYYQAIADKRKRFELRTNDRDFQVFDELMLREWDPEELAYTGRMKKVTVTYLLEEGCFGVPKGYVLMSF